MERPETEITVPARPERPETPPPPTFIIDGITIPADDVELIFDDDIIAGYTNENATVANTENQEALVITNAGDQAPPSRSIRSQTRDRKNLIQTHDKNTIIDTSEYSFLKLSIPRNSTYSDKKFSIWPIYDHFWPST